MRLMMKMMRTRKRMLEQRARRGETRSGLTELMRRMYPMRSELQSAGGELTKFEDWRGEVVMDVGAKVEVELVRMVRKVSIHRISMSPDYGALPEHPILVLHS